MQIDEDQTRQSDRDVEKENEAPMKIAHDEPSRDRPEHGGDQGRYGDKAHRAQQIRLRKGSHQREPAYRNHHRSAATLQDATCDE
jgi:hypothetical protein